VTAANSHCRADAHVRWPLNAWQGKIATAHHGARKSAGKSSNDQDRNIDKMQQLPIMKKTLTLFTFVLCTACGGGTSGGGGTAENNTGAEQTTTTQTPPPPPPPAVPAVATYSGTGTVTLTAPGFPPIMDSAPVVIMIEGDMVTATVDGETVTTTLNGNTFAINVPLSKTSSGITCTGVATVDGTVNGDTISGTMSGNGTCNGPGVATPVALNGSFDAVS